MEKTIQKKIVILDELVENVKQLKKKGKVVVQSHGVFDIIHPGILEHLNAAKKQGDTLVVTVIKDKDVRKGPNRPLFPELFRAENVASLEQVDYVCLVDDAVPFECVKLIQPDIFAKGQLSKKSVRELHEKVFAEKKNLYFGKSRIYETGGFSFSSSHIINNFLDIYPKETKDFLKKFSAKYNLQNIAQRLNTLQDLNVLIIGDGIVDEYHYCSSMSASAKANLVVNKYLTHEIFAGGSFAIANHLAGLCGKVHLVTLLGADNSKEDFILKNLKPNVSPKFFYRENGPTIVKKRYIDQDLNQKLFEINYLNDEFINRGCERDIVNYLKSGLPKYDLVLIADFGHGFITDNIIKVLRKLSKKVAVNTQTNGANSGYNMITKYNRPDFVCLDESEARWATQERFSNIECVLKKLSKILNAESIIITLGRKGSIGINKKNGINRTPIFSSKVIDTVGAGDAFFAFTAPCFAKGFSLDLVSFIGNTVGALAVQIVCNKKPIEKYELLEFMHAILR